jgi:hypothetical protein
LPTARRRACARCTCRPGPGRAARTASSAPSSSNPARSGLSYLLLDDTLASIGAAGAAVQGRRCAAALAGDGPTRRVAGARALGFAAVNALTRELFDRAGFVPPPAADSIGGLDPQPGESSAWWATFRRW